MSVTLPVHVEPVLEWRRERGVRSGELTVSGTVHLPELQAEFRVGPEGNGNGGGPAADCRGTVPLVPRRFSLPISPQRLRAPEREASDVWVLTTASGDDSESEHYAGELDGESFPFDQHMSVEGMLDVAFSTAPARAGAATTLQVAGELRFERSVGMRLLFRPPARPETPPSDTDPEQVELIPAGTRIPVVSQTATAATAPDTRLTVRVMGVASRTAYAESSLIPPKRSTS